MSTEIKKINMVIVTIVILLIAQLCYAKNINIKSSNIYNDNNILYLDSYSEILLTKEAYNALLHGISFQIHADFELFTKNHWLFKNIIANKKLKYKLEHKPLTENFLITDLSTGIKSYYKNVDHALKSISNINKMKLLNKNKLDKKKNYIARIKFYLSIDSLPSPMRPRAYFSSDWNISSNWYEWEYEN